MIEITPFLFIDDSEIQLDFIRASGPGGQNVNKVSTSVQLRFNVTDSPALSAEIKERLIKLAGSRMTDEGILVIEAKRCRTQEQNRQDALQRLQELIRQALQKPHRRRKTKPSLASKAARVANKRHHSEIKRNRRQTLEAWEK
jgi:ribosome-associated protein